MKFEQFHVGQIFRTAEYTITLEEIIEYSRKYDPHYYHLDVEKAEESYFGSIVASGMHTMLGDDMLGGMGIDAKWLKPVLPNDTIFADVEVINKKNLGEESGLLTLQITSYNQEGEIWAKGKIRIIVKTIKSSIDKVVV